MKLSKKEIPAYKPADIEPKWQKKWKEAGIYNFKIDQSRTKYYNLVEFPYPSGDLHLGHWYAFVAPDAHARYKRMKGCNVFFPNGFDAFGLPAENAAIKRGIHPKDWTLSNIETMTKQFATMGTMIDWSHKVITCLPEYYRWNQWIFIKMFERGVAYKSKTLSNWCPVDQTVLANEHVENGKCWRCATDVVQKQVEQWFLKITDYADRLVWNEETKTDWPQSVRVGQNNWIGKSEGAAIKFEIQNTEKYIETFTVFPETIYGVTFLVLAPEHPSVRSITSLQQKDEVERYISRVEGMSELKRKENEEKTGVFTGAFVTHPITSAKIPVWISDYVIGSYGTGAVMGVPASDKRDFEFAKKYNLPILRVIGKDKDDSGSIESEKEVLEEGVLVNSAQFSGLTTPNPGREKIKDFIEETGLGRRQEQYHLHDWSISRQRYWGTPVPMIHCDKCAVVPVPYDDLPVTLPDISDYSPRGKAPLATATDWVNVKCPKCARQARRETETLDTFFDSSWYFMRYLDPDYDGGPFDLDLAKKLTPVDVYFGGAEHTLGHTLYARFFTKFFKDLGFIDFDEFALKRIQHGVILGPDGNRMSKSKGNVVNPDDVVEKYGADTVRLYLCFMMPYDATAPWSSGAISGINRFLWRVWDLKQKLSERDENKEDLIWLNKTIKKVGEDLEHFKFNTAVAALMEWLNYLTKKETISEAEYEAFLLLLAPFAPHVTEELWQNSRIKEFDSIHLQSWPEYNPDLIIEEKVTIVIQVNGKVRERLKVDSKVADNQGEVERMAFELENVKKWLDGKAPKKTIFVPSKLLNVVI